MLFKSKYSSIFLIFQKNQNQKIYPYYQLVCAIALKLKERLEGSQDNLFDLENPLEGTTDSTSSDGETQTGSFNSEEHDLGSSMRKEG